MDPNTTGREVMRPVYRDLTAQEQGHVTFIKDTGAALWDRFNSLGPSRELSLAKTALEEAVMWAVKHVTR